MLLVRIICICFSTVQMDRQVWNHFQGKVGIQCKPSLTQASVWIAKHCGGSGLGAVITKLSSAAVVYHTWRERNFRIFPH